jgi:glycerol-3-phosphate acyltransferase PlsY
MLESIQSQIPWLVIPGSYLIGSVSWGLIIGKLTRGIDVRDHGSGSTGSTNVLRTLGTRLGALVFLLDVSKGVLAIIAAKLVGDDPLIDGLAALAVIVGHNWPILSRFQGGRGIAPAVGALSVLAPPATAIAVVAFIPAVLMTRYVSLGSLLAVTSAIISMPVLAFLNMAPWEYIAYTMIGGPLIIIRHKENIRRLLEGTERRLSF